jgi:hypothetical protein
LVAAAEAHGDGCVVVAVGGDVVDADHAAVVGDEVPGGVGVVAVNGCRQ